MKKNKAGTQRKKKHVSVKWRLILILLCINVVTLALIWLGQTFFLDKIYIRIKTSELVSGGNKLSAAQTDEQREQISEDLADSGLCTAVYRLTDAEGGYYAEEICSCQSRANCGCYLHRTLIFRPGGPMPDQKRIKDFRNVITQVNKAGGVCFLNANGVAGTAAKAGGQELTRVVITKDGEGSAIACFLNTTIVPLASTVKTLNSMLLYISVGVVATSIIFALAIALWVTHPISEVNRTAKKLAESSHDVTFNARGYKEIEELCDTLNYAASELSKVDNLQKELVANISHDLRTPLTLISGYAEVMRDLPDENTEENLQIIIDESNRMKALVNDVLDISKIRSGTAPFVMENVGLTNCVESELTRYNKLRDREGYAIEFLYDTLVTVRGDCSRLMQVVYNLVNNAVTYTGEDKKVTVTQTVRNGKVRISVRDTGAGIAPEELPLIWDRYYKVDKTHKRAQIGTGLGLSIVKSIVEAHGGTCGAESVQGEGSTFWFELDVLSCEPLPAQ